jgi:hypothetical protein
MAECAEPVTAGAGRVVIVEGTGLGHYALPPCARLQRSRRPAQWHVHGILVSGTAQEQSDVGADIRGWFTLSSLPGE